MPSLTEKRDNAHARFHPPAQPRTRTNEKETEMPPNAPLTLNFANR
jgi:hypothetical protein